MAKRQKLDYDSEGLTENLQRSAGQGVDAFFPQPSPPRSQQATKPRPAKPPKQARRRPETPRKRAQKVKEVGRYLPEQKRAKTAIPTPEVDTTVGSRHHDTRAEPTTPRAHDSMTSTRVEAVRRAVKQVGKEAATHRFTVEEKRTLTDLVYTYGRQGYRTTENEITRIAINWLLLDYQENGTRSVLQQVLKALKE